MATTEAAAASPSEKVIAPPPWRWDPASWVRFAPLLVLVAFILWMGYFHHQNVKWIDLATEASYLAAAAVGLNILLGYTGLLSLGHAGFFVAGGYAGAIFTPYILSGSFLPDLVTRNAPWLGIPMAFVFGALLGALLALMCCHLRGFYLTVVTLAFGSFLPALNEVLREHLGGVGGRTVEEFADTSNAVLARDAPRAGLFYVSSLFLLVTLFLTWNLVRSRWGRAYMAIRESEVAARTSGVNAYWYKVSSFALSAGFVAVAGWVAAQQILSVSTGGAADVQTRSFRMVVMIVIGGMGTLAGPVIGAFALTFFFGMTWVQETFRNYLGLLFGAVGLITVATAPEGAVGSFRKAVNWVQLSRARREEPPTMGDERPVGVMPADALRGERDRPPPEAGAPLLDVVELTKTFGGVAALSKVDLAVRPGTVHALIGPNGSGKTTFVNVVSGIYSATSGRVMFRDDDIGNLPPHRRSRVGIARTFQNLQVWRRMTVVQNVMVGAHGRGGAGLTRALLGTPGSRREERQLEEQAWAMLGFVGLAARGREPASALAFADQRRLEVARALAHDPELLLLDEPAAGMHPGEMAQLVELIQQVREAGITVLLIEHHVDLVMGLSDRVSVLDYGVKISEGTPDEVRSDERVIAAYLGHEAS